jgi:hypothetical protein
LKACRIVIVPGIGGASSTALQAAGRSESITGRGGLGGVFGGFAGA